jgi:hypothetical protein
VEIFNYVRALGLLLFEIMKALRTRRKRKEKEKKKRGWINLTLFHRKKIPGKVIPGTCKIL